MRRSGSQCSATPQAATVQHDDLRRLGCHGPDKQKGGVRLDGPAPEQATLNNVDIDARSDIYSLAVVLYELLTGSTPLTDEDLQRASVMEVLRCVREQEPPRPSARLSSSGHLAELAARRRLDAKRLAGTVAGDLDWIAMKALDKDRDRRYDSAGNLADDVERHLANEPVHARPPAFTYRVRKFVRRNRMAVTAVACVLVAMVLGIVGTTAGLLSAMKSEREARQEKERADREAQSANEHSRVAKANATEAQKQTAEAQREQRQTRRVLDLTRLRLAQTAFDERDFHLSRRTLDEIAPENRCLVWNVMQRRLQEGSMRLDGRITTPMSHITAFAFSADRDRIVAGTFHGEVHMWNGRTGESIRCVQERLGRCHSIACSADGKRIAQSIHYPHLGPMQQGSVVVFFDESGKAISVLERTGAVVDLAMSADGNRLAMVTNRKQEKLQELKWEASVTVWDQAQNKECFRLVPKGAEVECMTLSGDGRELAVATSDKTVRIWDVDGNRVVFETRLASPVADLALSEDNQRILVGAEGKAILLNRKTGERIFAQEVGVKRTGGGADGRESCKRLKQMTLSADGTRVASQTPDKCMTVWDVPSGKVVKSIPTWGRRYKVQLDAAGTRVAFETESGYLSVAPVTRGDSEFHLPHATESVRWLGTSPDGNRALIAFGDRTSKPCERPAEVWNPATRQKLFTITLDGKPVSLACGAWSKDGSILVVSFQDRGGQVIDGNSGKILRSIPRLKGNGDDNNHRCSLAISGDGKWLAESFLWSENLRLFDVTTGKAVCEIDGEKHVNAMAFSDDNRLLATGDLSGRVKVWDVPTGKLRASLVAHHRGESNNVKAITFDPTGTKVISSAYNNIISDIATEQTLHTFGGGVEYLRVDPSGRRLIASRAGKTTVWDLDSAIPLLALDAGDETFLNPGTRQLISFHKEAQSFSYTELEPPASCGQKLTLAVGGPFDVFRMLRHGLTFSAVIANTVVVDAQGATVITIPRSRKELTSQAITDDGRLLALGYEDGAILVYDLKTKALVRQFDLTPAKASWLQFSPDGQRLLACGSDKDMHRWQLEGGQKQTAIRLEENVRPPDSVCRIDADAIYQWRRHRPTLAWNAHTGNPLIDPKIPPMPDPRILSLDGKFAFVLGSDEFLRIPVRLEEPERQRRLWATRPDPEWHVRRQKELIAAKLDHAAHLHRHWELKARGTLAQSDGDMHKAKEFFQAADRARPTPPALKPSEPKK